MQRERSERERADGRRIYIRWNDRDGTEPEERNSEKENAGRERERTDSLVAREKILSGRLTERKDECRKVARKEERDGTSRTNVFGERERGERARSGRGVRGTRGDGSRVLRGTRERARDAARRGARALDEDVISESRAGARRSDKDGLTKAV